MTNTKPVELKPSFIVAHKRQIYSLGWNCNGDKLATGSVDTSIKIWKLHEGSGKLLDNSNDRGAELKGHTESINHLAWHPDNPDQLVSQSEKSVRLWDAKTSKCVASLNSIVAGHSLAWSPNGREIAVTNDDLQLVIVDARKMRISKTINTNHAINRISWSRNGKLMFTATSDGTLEVFQYPSLVKLWEVQAHTASIYSMAVSRDNRWAATGGADAILALWDLEHMVCSKTIYRMDLPVRDVVFSHDSQYLAYAATDAFVEVLDMASGTAVARINAASMNLACDLIAWNPKKQFIAVAGMDNTNTGRDSGVLGVCAATWKK